VARHYEQCQEGVGEDSAPTVMIQEAGLRTEYVSRVTAISRDTTPGIAAVGSTPVEEANNGPPSCTCRASGTFSLFIEDTLVLTKLLIVVQ
jgi:hypothetical protein